MKYIAHDTETTLIGLDNIIPDIICSSFYDLEQPDPWVKHWSPKQAHVDYVTALLEDPDQHIIYHNASFDLGVLSKYEWDMLPAIWKALEDGKIHDTMIREMLLNLTTTGSLDLTEVYGIQKRTSYALAALVLKYLNIDIKEEKEAVDSVRTNYEAVRHLPLEEWPKEYIEYAGKDAEYTGLVFLAQEQARQACISSTGYDPFVKESFTVNTALSLYFMTAQGNKLDKERVAKVAKEYTTLYNSDALVWPLVHSRWVQKCQERQPKLSHARLIEYAKKEWEGVKDKAYWKGTGIISPAIPPTPIKSGTLVHEENCQGHVKHPDHTKGHIYKSCGCPPKMKMAQAEKGSTINLHQYIWTMAQNNPSFKLWLSKGYADKMAEFGMEVPHPIEASFIAEHETVPFLDLGGKKGTRMALRVDKEWLATFAHLDPVLSVYNERHKIQKIVTSSLPCMYWADGYKTGCPVTMEGQTDKLALKAPADRVHAQYAPLKETGRTSSYASKHGLGSKATITFPSWNGQQVPPAMRGCVIPDEGNALFSIDYSAMELCTAAQVSHDLLGYEGVLMGLINEGKDTHSYLGAQIAVALDPEFTSAWGLSEDDPAKTYELFKAVSSNTELCDSEVFRGIFDESYLGKKWGEHIVTWDDCTMKAYYKHFRTFGKPTGLGFWGGLGEPTFVSMAKASYGIQVDLEIAKTLRQIWRTYIPEGQAYLDYVSKHMIDVNAPAEMVEDANGKQKRRNFYCYDTPMGMHRARCSFTAAANGCALQSPSAEGALSGVQEIMKECTVGSLAGSVFPSLFIHDEIVGEITLDEHTTSRIEQLQEIMVRNMQKITPKVRASTEPALMMRWSKFAEPVYDKAGKLCVWEEQ